MPPHPFVAATTPDASGALELTAAWGQGPGVYGGVTAAALARSMEAAVGDASRPLRSLTVHFCRPALPGRATVRARVERAGGSISQASARMLDAEGEVVAFATGSHAAPRRVERAWSTATLPPANDPEAVPSIPIHELGGPVFAQFFEYRHAGGAGIWSGAQEGVLGTWIRPRQPLRMDAALAAGLLDAGPPALMARETGPRPVTSVDFRVQLRVALPVEDLSPDAWILLWARTRVVEDGYADETTEMWTRDGRFLGTCEQLIALLG